MGRVSQRSDDYPAVRQMSDSLSFIYYSVWTIYGSDCVTTRRYSGDRSLIGRNSFVGVYGSFFHKPKPSANIPNVHVKICLELGGNSGITVIVTDNGRRVESESWNVAATDQITQGAVGDSNIEQGEDVGLIEIANQLWTDAVRQNSLRDDTSSKTCVLLGLVQFASVDGFVYRKNFSTSEILQFISCLFLDRMRGATNTLAIRIV
ncbi:unnamed protein product, partial [Fusarium graminearum]